MTDKHPSDLVKKKTIQNTNNHESYQDEETYQDGDDPYQDGDDPYENTLNIDKLEKNTYSQRKLKKNLLVFIPVSV